VRTADASACGHRSAELLDPQTESERIFLFRGRESRCWDHNEYRYSVKIVHAVRSAITAIAELVGCWLLPEKLAFARKVMHATA